MGLGLAGGGAVYLIVDAYVAERVPDARLYRRVVGHELDGHERVVGLQLRQYLIVYHGQIVQLGQVAVDFVVVGVAHVAAGGVNLGRVVRGQCRLYRLGNLKCLPFLLQVG